MNKQIKIYYTMLPVGFTQRDLKDLEKNLLDEKVKDEYIYSSPQDIKNEIKNRLNESLKDYEIIMVMDFESGGLHFNLYTHYEGTRKDAN